MSTLAHLVLLVTIDQLNTAKEIVLDLLGWGVAPEVLVDCGVSREAVFYTFTELNLRLPANLNTSGLVPFPPPPPPSSTTVTTTPAAPTKPLPAKPSTSDVQESPDKKTATTSLPSNSHTPTSPSTSVRDVPSPSMHPTTSPSPTDPGQSQSLADMEAQKRQQLIARKTALASRKKKAAQDISSIPTSAPSITTASASVLTDIADDKIVHNEAAENFLQSVLGATSVLPLETSSLPSAPTGTPATSTDKPVSSSSTSPTLPTFTPGHAKRKSSGGVVSGGVSLGVPHQRSPTIAKTAPRPPSISLENIPPASQDIKDVTTERELPPSTSTPISATSAKSASSQMSVSPVVPKVVNFTSKQSTAATEVVIPLAAEGPKVAESPAESSTAAKEDKRDTMDIDIEADGIPGFGNYNRIPPTIPAAPIPKTGLENMTLGATTKSSTLDPSAAPFEPASISITSQTPSLSLSSSEQSQGSTRTPTPNNIKAASDKPDSAVTPVSATFPTTTALPISASKSALAASNESHVLPPKLQASGRRGLKRPVAMDFVDMDSPTESESFNLQRTTSQHSGNTGGSNPAPPPHVRRKIHGGPGQYGSFGHASSSGSFAGLGIHHHRRCVIEVSDSEDEPEEPGGDKGGGVIGGGGRAGERAGSIPRRPASTVPSRSDAMTPASLAEKEAQIKAMKELIAKRERERLQKLEVSRSSLFILIGQPATCDAGKGNGVSLRVFSMILRLCSLKNGLLDTLLLFC